MSHSDREIDTERLMLRLPSREHFERSVAMWSDAEVTRFIGGRSFTREETWARLLRYVGHWQMLDYGYWVVLERETGSYIGEVGFADYHRDLGPTSSGAPEAGWALVPRVHGKGYATEAVRAATRWADRRWPNGRTICMIDPQNALSLRVAEKCGYAPVRRATYRGVESTICERVGGAVLR
ncbi:GNAT family N-acetyltransferase [Trinickia dabaoshanensis]|uniref:GNAT family N-acetyltransferase n=1 Tax=Trinickia dabaoshanensis TaxID=564714 RepID=A0A2N7VL05_9BURK|nr:GNAT family N-acetyltransferase [Trinickia dabaoshanensis]PMS17823.1 GNAT family N-acetyltransferase [Trinickia dabaoshanensis]